MKQELPAHGISCVELPRLTSLGKAISASDVRLALKNDDYALLKKLVPDSTYRYFTSGDAADVILKMKKEINVVHY